MIRKLSEYLRGGIRVTARGAFPERFLNLCVTERIPLWGVQKKESALTAWMLPRDFCRVRPIARRSRMRVRIARRYGLPFLLKRLKKRKMLLGGAAGFLLALYWLSTYIWFVEISGLKSLPEEAVRALAAEYGIAAGAPQSGAQLKAFEKAMLLRFPAVAWTGARFTGTRLVVEVVERAPQVRDDRSPGDLVAAKRGVITQCIALEGERAVAVGDTVEAGDVLIRGCRSRLLQSASETGPERREWSGVKAAGIVKAKVVYESLGEAALQKPVYTLTGRQAYGFSLRWEDGAFTLKRAHEEEFAAYEHEKIVKRFPWWRNSAFSVELIKDIYDELAVEMMAIDEAEAQQLAALDALEKSGELVPRDAYVTARRSEALEAQDGVVRVKLTIETEEEIGRSIRYDGE